MIIGGFEEAYEDALSQILETGEATVGDLTISFKGETE
jgi:hypothetical protein